MLTTMDSATCGANPTLSQISRAHCQNAATDRQRTLAAIGVTSDETPAPQAFAVMMTKYIHRYT
jgi:uncharacterized protein YjdB